MAMKTVFQWVLTPNDRDIANDLYLAITGIRKIGVMLNMSTLASGNITLTGTLEDDQIAFVDAMIGDLVAERRLIVRKSGGGCYVGAL